MNEGVKQRHFLCLLIFFTILSTIQGQSVDLPASVSIYELGLLEINCTTSGTSDNLQHRWSKEGDATFRQDTHMLSIPNIMNTGAGRYRCSVTDLEPPWQGYGETQVFVEFSPRWHPYYATKKFAGNIGQRATLTCTVMAHPVPTFTWQFKGGPFTSISGRTVFKDSIEISSVREQDYGVYKCEANNTAGLTSYDLTLQAPGTPDSPLTCRGVNVTYMSAVVACVPGFQGGEPLDFTVIKSGPHVAEDKVIPSRFEMVGEEAVINGTDLYPNLTYTLKVFQKNTHGQSTESFSIVIHTDNGVIIYPPSDDNGWMIGAIIGGVIGGILLIILIIVCICLVCKARKKKTPRASTDTGSRNTLTRNSQDELYQNDLSRQYAEPPRAFKGRNPDPNRGRDNSAYFSDKQPAGPPPNYNEQPPPQYSRAPPTGQPPNVLQLQGFKPGESDVGFNNPAYHRDTMETNIDGPAIIAKSPIGVDHNTLQRAKRMSKEQPNLAGMGALANYPIMGPIANQRQQGPPPNQAGPYGNPNQPESIQQHNPTYQPNSPQHRNSTFGTGPHGAPVMRNDNPQEQDPNAPKPPPRPEVKSYRIPDEIWEFPRDQLYIREKIGDGTFGEVWKAKAEGILGRQGKTQVAVKMLRDDFNQEEKRCLLKELETMKGLHPHPNVIGLMGCCSSTDPVYIIMEFAALGNLQDFLRKNRSILQGKEPQADPNLPAAISALTSRDLYIFALHVARGMQFISSKQLLHRDLAARNVLVGDDLTCKISDFGLARDIISSRQYETTTQRKLPIRWMAPESLFDCVYTTKSDVWSFGILLWEVVTLGSSPYPGMSGPDVMELLQMGYRMDKPKLCSPAMYQLMRDCWKHVPEERPSFGSLCKCLEALIKDLDQIISLSQMGDNVFDIYSNLPGEKC